MQRISLVAAFAAALFVSSTAQAHISIANPSVAANTSGQKITFSISHGCGTSDTTAIKVDIPAGVLTSIRPLYSDFGAFTVTKAGAPAQVTSITWTKALPALGADDAFYEVTIRARVADMAFTQVPITVTQTCADGTVVPWDQPPGSTTGEPAPVLTIVPARSVGWNKFTLSKAVTVAELPIYFKEAQIVWKGTAAFSTNLVTTMLIATTTNVTPLAADLAIGDEIWVKY